tara:strand:+ start:1715 stop:2113 length:399 start_codon:yes stop_codon:yes gene_type:complete
MVVKKNNRKKEKKKQLIGGISNDTLFYIIGGTIVGLVLIMFLYLILKKKTPEPSEVEDLKNKITDLLDQVNKFIPALTSTDKSSLKSYNLGDAAPRSSNQTPNSYGSWRGMAISNQGNTPGKPMYMLLVKDS